MVSWATIQTLLFTFGPLAIPRLISWYRSIRASSGPAHGVRVQPVPRRIRQGLNILFAAAFLALLSSLEYLQPPNIFRATDSRLQIPTDVLFTRLAARRPLTARDETLKFKFAALDVRLQYVAFGPDAVIDCRFCHPDEPKSYLYYSLPAIVMPHLLHIGLLGLLTSSLLFGPEAAVWRTQATIAGAAVAALEIYVRATYDVRANAAATRLAEIDFLHWRLLAYRGVAIAAVDAALGWMLYLSSTNRAFVKAPSPDERLHQTAQLLESATRKLHALGMTKSTVSEDAHLRSLAQNYWDVASQLMTQLRQDRLVRQQMRAVETRLDMNAIGLEADRYAEAVIMGSRGAATSFVPVPPGSRGRARSPPPSTAAAAAPQRAATPIPAVPDIEPDAI